MAKSNFEIGDIVTLKSGGPKMTIKEIKTREFLFAGGSNELDVNKIKTQWFEGSEIKSGEFSEPQLELSK
ncbi:MAG TPA: DUF2158 domain-containing protein [Chryseobacterium sp.]|nr:DUF2158 domain-containing protein [Chryseobacterium sp.]